MKKILILIILLSLPLAQAETFQEKLKPELDNIEVPIEQLKFVLPATIKIITPDTGEELFISLEKTGKVSLDKKEKVDIIIEGTKNNIEKLLNTKDLNELRNNIDLITIQTPSIKGKFGVELIEDLFDIKFVKKKPFSQKLVSVVTAPIAKIAKWFM